MTRGKLHYRYLRFPVAAVLFFAATAKMYQTATEPSEGIPWFAMGVFFFEMVLGTFLLSGIWQRWVKWITMTVFTVFFTVACQLAFQSADSCGCFGKIHVDPRITLCLDAGIVIMLYFAQTGSNQGRPFRSQTLLVRGGVLITLILLLPMLFHPPMERFDHGVAVAMVSAAPKKSEFVLPDSSGQDMPCRMLLPQEFHLGYVTPKSVHRFALELTNPTEESWYIDEIETECSCITVKERRELIGPHERAILDFEFTAPDIAGPYTKTITVRSAEKEWTTRFHARIDFPLVSEPEQLVRSLHRVSKPDEVILRNDGPVPIRLLYATVLPPVCTMKIGNDSVPAGGALTLPVQWLEEQGEAVVTIHTNHKRQKTLKVSIVP